MTREAIEEALAALRLSRTPGVGAATFKKLIASHSSARAAEEAFEQRASARRQQPKSATGPGLGKAVEYLEAGGTVLVLGGAGYPSQLAEMSEPPPVLFVKGSVEAVSRPMVAVVGARDCSERGLERAEEAALALVRSGFGVASGGARGIDGRAHQAALAAGGVTVAALGTGIDVVYPSSHRNLFQEIEKSGALVSELLPATPPAPKFFPTRNRIIAGLSIAVIVIEGRRISGSLSTARWAIKLGRKVASPAAESEEGLGEAAGILKEQGACVYAEREGLEEFIQELRARAFGGAA